MTVAARLAHMNKLILFLALVLTIAGCGSTISPAQRVAADTCGRYAVPQAELAQREEERPNGSPDLEFTDKGRAILLLEGQSCIDEHGLPNSVTDGEIYRDKAAPPVPKVTKERRAAKATPPAQAQEDNAESHPYDIEAMPLSERRAIEAKIEAEEPRYRPKGVAPAEVEAWARQHR
jgi:uncharacterized protein YceK